MECAKPVLTEFFDKNKRLTKQWRNDEYQLHREDGPAYIVYKLNGSIGFEEFRINGVPHNRDGAAVIAYKCDGSISWESYCISGVYYTFWNFWDKLNEDERRSINILKCLARYS
jgi:hypothetical protein